MKTLLLYLVSFIALLSPLQAEIIESNITLQLNVYVEIPMVTKGNIIIDSYQITSYKTGDIAEKIAASRGLLFTNKAQIIEQMTVNADGGAPSVFLIRDKGKADLFLTNNEIDFNAGLSVGKYRTDTKKQITTGVVLGNSDLTIRLNGDSEVLFLRGPSDSKRRIMRSKQFPDHVLRLHSRSMTCTGEYNNRGV